MGVYTVGFNPGFQEACCFVSPLELSPTSRMNWFLGVDPELVSWSRSGGLVSPPSGPSRSSPLGGGGAPAFLLHVPPSSLPPFS
jgi:hypothetical protein